MDYLAAGVKRLLYSLFVFLNRIAAALTLHRQIHNARFARIDELSGLLTSQPVGETGLLLGVSYLNQPLSVRPTKTRRELGKLLVVAPTRGGKGLLATAQLLSWKHSVVVNDIKGELFAQTAGYRSTLGPVFVIDPTGIGHSYDPLAGKHTEDELFSSATHLLFKPTKESPSSPSAQLSCSPSFFWPRELKTLCPPPSSAWLSCCCRASQRNFPRACNPVS